jgi:ADP-ribose pyrophosphatase YjhB (NUDIX family)
MQQDLKTPAKVTRSAGGVVINDEGQVLVVSQHGTSWSLPKGHIEEGEDVIAAAKREIMEESGVLQLELMKEYPMYERMKIGLDGGDDPSELKLIHMFLFKTSQMELHPNDTDNPEAIWVEPQNVAELLTHPKDKSFFESVLSDIMMYIQSKEGQKIQR